MNIIKWPGLTPYPEALARLDSAVADVLAGGPEQLILCEHEPVFTVGSSGSAAAEVLNAGDIPVLQTGRGGKTTYHGPGQRVVYPIINLGARNAKDLHAYIATLQSVVVEALASLGVESTARTGEELGVWVNIRYNKLDSSSKVAQNLVNSAGQPNGWNDDWGKIAAFGVRVRRWVAFHGLALNVSPDMEHFPRIKPCGLTKPTTSLHALGMLISMEEVDAALLAAFAKHFSA